MNTNPTPTPPADQPPPPQPSPEAVAAWAGVKDPDAWLAEVRGTETAALPPWRPLEEDEDLAATIAELAEVQEENKRLRAALAHSDQPCAYCSLPYKEFAQCSHGFPGCSRADDMLGCPHLMASIELADLKVELAALKAAQPQPQHLERPDGPGWWWKWEDGGQYPHLASWAPRHVTLKDAQPYGKWVRATPPPTPEEEK